MHFIFREIINAYVFFYNRSFIHSKYRILIQCSHCWCRNFLHPIHILWNMSGIRLKFQSILYPSKFSLLSCKQISQWIALLCCEARQWNQVHISLWNKSKISSLLHPCNSASIRSETNKSPISSLAGKRILFVGWLMGIHLSSWTLIEEPFPPLQQYPDFNIGNAFVVNGITTDGCLV